MSFAISRTAFYINFNYVCSPSNGALSIQYSLLEAAFCTSVCKGTFDETIVICCKNYFLFSQYYLVSTESIFSNYVISLFVLLSFSVLFCFYLLIIFVFLFYSISISKFECYDSDFGFDFFFFCLTDWRFSFILPLLFLFTF